MNLRAFALLLCVVAPIGAASAPAAAQGSYSPFDESPAAALARYVRTLATSPKDFSSLVGAGRAALELGDTQAAAGFFARADEVNPRSPLPQAGMGAVSVANGEPLGALPYFERAKQLGAPVASFGCDRGLAFDLLGRQADAQADYRAALSGRDSDETRRRLALSLAISGDKAGALAALAPLLARGDAGAARSRAFVLALSGDSSGAMAAIDGAMPGSWSRVAPFLSKLPTLNPAQKAAAVNLGIFPDAGETAFAYAPPSARPSAPPIAGPVAAARSSGSVSNDRLVGVEALLANPAAPAQPQAIPAPPPAPQPIAPAPQRVAMASPPMVAAPASASPTISAVRARKIWLQLASGSNAEALPSQFQRMKSKNRDLFDGISGYVARGPDRARLVIGPFRSANDADTLAEDLQSVDVRAFKWSNSESDTIVPLGTQ